MTNSKRSRELYTKSLSAICQTLDKSNTIGFSWRHPIVRIDCQSRATIKSLWVAGSYARGALTCGDLDLVVEIDWQGGPVALPRQVFKALFIHHRGISLCDGTPDNNSSHVLFGEAILIWDKGGNDWCSAIDNIAPDPNATRFSRATDDIPFRPEQLNYSIEKIIDLLVRREKGLIKWSFTPFGSAAIQGPQTKHETDALSLFESCGTKTRLLLPHLLPYFYIHQWPSAYRRAQLSRNTFHLGDSTVVIGRPAVPITLLDTLTTACLMIVPHMRGDAINGVWCIERGDLHPLTLATEPLKIWALSDSSGQLDFYDRAGFDEAGAYDDSNNAIAIDLFTSFESAQHWVDTAQDDNSPIVKPVYLTPQTLLACIAAADIVSVNIADFAVTRSGARILGVVGTVTPAALIDVLTR